MPIRAQLKSWQFTHRLSLAQKLNSFAFQTFCINNFKLNLWLLEVGGTRSLLPLMNTTRFYSLSQSGCLCLRQFRNIFAIVNCIFHPIKWVAIEPTNHTSCKGFVNMAICHFVLPHDPFVKFKNTLYHLSRNFSIISIPILWNFGPKNFFNLGHWYIFLCQT
jgi:hypothetical protein